MTMKTWLALATLGMGGIIGCSSEPPEPDPNAFFPANYLTSFSQIGECQQSTTHSNPYYLFHLTASSEAAFKAGMPLPEGTVLVKTQYADDACTEFSWWTAMKKREAGFDMANNDWEWQNVNDDGEIVAQGKLGVCSGCHSACPGGVCTK